MKQLKTTGSEAQEKVQGGSNLIEAPGLDSQYAELIETVWACERTWQVDNRIDAVIRYAR